MADSPSRSEVYGNFQTLGDRLDFIDGRLVLAGEGGGDSAPEVLNVDLVIDGPAAGMTTIPLPTPPDFTTFINSGDSEAGVWVGTSTNNVPSPLSKLSDLPTGRTIVTSEHYTTDATDQAQIGRNRPTVYLFAGTSDYHGPDLVLLSTSLPDAKKVSFGEPSDNVSVQDKLDELSAAPPEVINVIYALGVEAGIIFGPTFLTDVFDGRPGDPTFYVLCYGQQDPTQNGIWEIQDGQVPVQHPIPAAGTLVVANALYLSAPSDADAPVVTGALLGIFENPGQTNVVVPIVTGRGQIAAEVTFDNVIPAKPATVQFPLNAIPSAQDPYTGTVQVDGGAVQPYTLDGPYSGSNADAAAAMVADFASQVTGAYLIQDHEMGDNFFIRSDQANSSASIAFEQTAPGTSSDSATGTDTTTVYFLGNNAPTLQKLLTTGTLVCKPNGNIAAGQAAQGASSSGANNVAIGRGAQPNVAIGGNNVGVGDNAQGSLTVGSENVAIGTYTDHASDSSRATALGAFAVAAHDRSVALGSETTTTAEDQVMVGGRDIEITDATKGYILPSPDGTRYRITVANGGTLSAVAVV